MTYYRPYRHRAGSHLTPIDRGLAWGFGLSIAFWVAGGIMLALIFW